MSRIYPMHKTYIEIPIDIKYNVVPESGDGWHEPVEPAYIEIISIKSNNVEISDVISQEEMDKLTIEIEEYEQSSYEDFLDSQAEMAWEDKYGPSSFD